MILLAKKSRLKRFSVWFILICLQVTFVLPVHTEAGEGDIAPTHEVQIEIKRQEDPTWKSVWDRAREYARSNRFDEAIKYYRDLLKLKPNIAEARWELCKLLILKKQWKESAAFLNNLLELDPHNIEYLQAAGNVAIENKHFQKAIKYFGQIYEREPYAPSSKEAIKGMITSFIQIGNLESGFLLLEQHYKQAEDKGWLLEKLTQMSQKLGKSEKARFYSSLLVKSFPDNKEFIKKAAKTHDFQGHREQAVNYWKKYLTLDENYLPYHEKLADFYLENERSEEALPHLTKLYELSPNHTDLGKKIGDIYYLKLKRLDKALLFYEQHEVKFSKDKKNRKRLEKVRASLASQYLPIVENGGVFMLWQDLEQIPINREMLFLKMAKLFRKQSKRDHEIEVLKILFHYDQANLDLAYKIAKLYRKQKKYEQAVHYFSILQNKDYKDPGYLLNMADMKLEADKQEQALELYLTYIQKGGRDIEKSSDALDLAGSVGLTQFIFRIWENIDKNNLNDNEYITLSLSYLDALRENGLFSSTESIYEELFSRFSGDYSKNLTVKFHRAETAALKGNLFEAEQIVRQILVSGKEVNRALEKLVRLAIEEAQLSKARSWFNLLTFRNNFSSEDRIALYNNLNLHFLYIDILMAEGEFEQAEDHIKEALNLHDINNDSKRDFKRKSHLYLADIYFQTNQDKKSLKSLKKSGFLKSRNNKALVLHDLVTKSEKGEREANKTISSKEKDENFSSVLEMAKMYHQYGHYSKALELVQSCLKHIPESLRAMVFKSEVLASLARYKEAKQIIHLVKEKYPEQDYFSKLQLNLEFKSGNFQEIVKELPLVEEVVRKDKKQKSSDFYFWKRLLLARSLWAEGRRPEAIQVYKSLIAVPIDNVFLEKIEVEKINLSLPPLKKSFWNKITFTQPKQPDPVTTVMDPHFVAKNIGHPVDDIAAGLYSKYRWQKLVKKELAARKAVEERDYFSAEKQYLSLLKEEKSQETLFDLASIYSLFGAYGKEAELYEIMKKVGPLYPGLDEYIKANTLKRQPRVYTNFITHSEKGRDGLLDMKKQLYGVEGWFMPSFDQEIAIGLFNNSYESAGDRIVRSSFLDFSYSTYFENSMDLNIEFGANKFEDLDNTEIIYKFELKGRLSDNLEVYGRFEQDLVEDNVQSIIDSIIYRDFEVGSKFDIFPKLFVGGDYRYRMYSDDNIQNRYKVWSMYHLFGDINQLKFKYSYEYKDNKYSNFNKGIFGETFKNDDIVYWSPEEYWRHLFTIHLTHLFVQPKRPDAPHNYCTFEYSYGYGDQNEQSHLFSINIFLEMDDHFLLKSNFSFDNGEEYKDTEAMISLIYRW